MTVQWRCQCVLMPKVRACHLLLTAQPHSSLGLISILPAGNSVASKWVSHDLCHLEFPGGICENERGIKTATHKSYRQYWEEDLHFPTKCHSVLMTFFQPKKKKAKEIQYCSLSLIVSSFYWTDRTHLDAFRESSFESVRNRVYTSKPTGESSLEAAPSVCFPSGPPWGASLPDPTCAPSSGAEELQTLAGEGVFSKEL